MNRFEIHLPVRRVGKASLGLASLGQCIERWHPGTEPAQHSEVFAEGGEAGGTAAALALAMDTLRSMSNKVEETRNLLWVQDGASARLNGRPYRQGLPRDLRHRMIHVLARKPEDALFALEEGMKCRDLACVIGEIVGNPRALDFTASRRFSLAAEKYGVPLFLVRLDARRDLSSARMRWQVRSAQSEPEEWNAEAPGEARWHAELFRSRTHAPGEWILHHDGNTLVAERVQYGGKASAPDNGDMAAAPADRTVAAG